MIRACERNKWKTFRGIDFRFKFEILIGCIRFVLILSSISQVEVVNIADSLPDIVIYSKKYFYLKEFLQGFYVFRMFVHIR